MVKNKESMEKTTKKQKREKIQKMGITNYPVGDFLIRIKNASLASRQEVMVPSTKLVAATANALKKAGFLEEVSQAKGILNVKIAYKKKRPVLMDLKLVSKPGLRIYLGVDDIESKKGPSLFLLTTPKGVVTSREAIKQRLGGEVLAEVW